MSDRAMVRWRISRLVGGLVAGVQLTSRALAMVATLVIFVMLLANAVDIALRTTIDQPVPGVYEYTGVALAAIVFLGIPYTMQVGGHVAIDSVTSRLPGWLRRYVEVAALITVVPFVGWLTYASVGVAIESFVAQEVEFGVIQAPVWPARMLIPLGAGLLAAEILIAVGRVLLGVEGAEASESRMSGHV